MIWKVLPPEFSYIVTTFSPSQYHPPWTTSLPTSASSLTPLQNVDVCTKSSLLPSQVPQHRFPKQSLASGPVASIMDGRDCASPDPNISQQNTKRNRNPRKSEQQFKRCYNTCTAHLLATHGFDSLGFASWCWRCSSHECHRTWISYWRSALWTARVATGYGLQKRQRLFEGSVPCPTVYLGCQICLA